MYLPFSQNVENQGGSQSLWKRRRLFGKWFWWKKKKIKIVNIHINLSIFYWKRIRRTFKRFSSTIVSLKLRAHQEERAESIHTFVSSNFVARTTFLFNELFYSTKRIDKCRSRLNTFFILNDNLTFFNVIFKEGGSSFLNIDVALP